MGWVIWLAISAAMAGDCAEQRDEQLIPVGEFAFASRTADLVESEGTVASVACALQAEDALRVQVEVHTDSRGSGSYNLRISQERADAIRAALLAAGVAPERVTAVGRGETLPLSAGYSPEEMAANRRIELHTGSPESRPPRPSSEPAPAPAPSPEPKVDPWCTELGAAIAGGAAARWTRAGGLDGAAGRMAACLGDGWTTQRDGSALYGTHADWSLVVEQGSDGVVVRLERAAGRE